MVVAHGPTISKRITLIGSSEVAVHHHSTLDQSVTTPKAMDLVRTHRYCGELWRSCAKALLACLLGKYIFIEASNSGAGKKARLLSERFKQTTANGYCLNFWYHMYGADIGTLNILIKNRPGNSTEKLVWSLSGNQNNVWQFGRVPIKMLTDSYQV